MTLCDKEASTSVPTLEEPVSSLPPPGDDDVHGLPPGGPWSPAYRLLTAGILLTIGGTAFEALAVATILPATVEDLGGIGLYGWAFSAFMLATLIGISVAGGEADLQGPAHPFALGVGFFVAGLLIGGAATSMAMLIAGRAVQGFGAGFIGSVAYVAVGRGLPPAAKPRMLALMSSAWVVPGLIGPALSGLVADHVGWRWVFLGLVPLMLVATVLALPALRRISGGSATGRDRRRLARAIQLAVGTGLFLAGLGGDNLLIAVPLVVAGAVLGWPALQHLMPAGTTRAAPGLPAAVATMGLLNLAFFGVDAFIPLALTAIRDRSASFASLALTAATVAWTAGSWVQARYARRISRRILVRTGLTLVAVGSVGIALVLAPSVPAVAAPVAWGIAGLGIGIAYSTISLVILETSPAGQEGVAAAGMQLANALGVALGAGLGGVLVAALSTTEEPSRASLLTQDLLMVGVLAISILITGRLPASAKPAEVPADVT
ncbi:MAG: MFS transporter [Chloroflexota bacterium]|nr:MFS transporter [Chloroflexota bacterium]